MAVKRVRVVHMVLNSLAVPSGFVGFLTATKDHTSASPTNTQKSSTSLLDGELGQWVRAFALVP